MLPQRNGSRALAVSVGRRVKASDTLPSRPWWCMRVPSKERGDFGLGGRPASFARRRLNRGLRWFDRIPP